jgi:SAM-dependent methyltransferase
VLTVDVGILRCPFDRAAVSPDGEGLRCQRCGRTFGVTGDGIPLMLHPDLPGAREKLREAEGWLEKAKSEGWYEPDDAVDAVLPFVNRELGWDNPLWLANGHSFQVLLDRYIKDLRGLRVLEIGAAKAWAARFWLERGCEFVATDILVDPKIGIGRGAFYGDFGRVQADGEHLPFADETFDVTYGVATLHHALDLNKMVAEMARVTRPGGIVAGLNEGTRAPYRSGANPEQEREKELGINEHVHTMWAYLWAFARAGLRPLRLEYAEGPAELARRTIAGRLLRAGELPATLWALNAYPYAGLSLYARRRSR